MYIYENRDNIKNPIDFAFRLRGCFLMKSGICFYEQLSVLILLGGPFVDVITLIMPTRQWF